MAIYLLIILAQLWNVYLESTHMYFSKCTSFFLTSYPHQGGDHEQKLVAISVAC